MHRDIKPENFCIGTGNDATCLYLIDYGLSKQYCDSSTKIHFEQWKTTDPSKFTGTLRYASVGAHRGLHLSRKDDLESLGYVMIYMYQGHLPW